MSTNDRTFRNGDSAPDSSPVSSRAPTRLPSRDTIPPPSAPPSSRSPGPLSLRSQGVLLSRPSFPPPSPSIPPPSVPPASGRVQAPTSSPPSSLSSITKAILALEKMKAKLELANSQKTEPIAIIGMACRFPGGADTPEAFFQLLESGGDAITEVPASRWRIEPAEDATAGAEQRAIRWGGFLTEAVDRFDARFFGISPREAEHLDPQQRMLLAVAWEALERAGQDPARLVGSSTGTFVGISNSDYLDLCKAAGREVEDVYMATGNGHAFAAGRLSYVLGLQGPSFAVDTLCSSSLVAVHLACQSLRSGEATLALACGVNLMLSPDTARLTATTQGLSPDGRCRTFDGGANGFVRSEGCGVVVLKLLSQAQKDGDPILALIRGSAVNQDGRSTGLTAPNVLSQQAMLQQALASARVTAEDIGYVETHGTGTPLGDPIEFEAMRSVFGATRFSGSRCVLGAVKTNVGHLEAAAGVAGLIKAVMVLREGLIPKNLHFRALNPRISLEGTPFVIPTENLRWARGSSPRFAGVSSFGMSGTNAHVILEEAPLEKLDTTVQQEPSSYLLPLSAKSPEALQALTVAYAEMLARADGASLRDIAHTASTRRMHHEHRLAFAGRTREDFAAALAKSAASDSVQASAAASRRPKVVFVFSGQGSQWIGMGRQLLAEEPVFRAALEECAEVLRRYVSWSLLNELLAPEERSRLSETKVVQPVLFAVQVALAKLLISWNIRPSAVIGHSVGEVAAAHVAGVLSLDEAARLVALRARIMQKATGLGKMVWVPLPAAEAAAAIAGYEADLAIAAINDPGSVVLSGATAALDDVVEKLSTRGIQCRPLKVNYAFHSPQMDPLARELVKALGRFEPRRATLPLYSTVTGAAIDGDLLDAAYWGRNVREPVQFARAMERAAADGHRMYLEVAPHPVLSTNMEQCLAEHNGEGLVVFTLRRKIDERVAMLEAAGTLYGRGVDVDWKALLPSSGRHVELPTYPWQSERYWVDGKSAGGRPTAEDPLADWFYRVDWPEMPRASADPRPVDSGSWLVFADRGGVGSAVAAALSSRGHSCTVLYAPAVASVIAEQVANVASGRQPFKGVLYLWGLDAVVEAGASADEVGEATRCATSPVLALVQALGAASRSPRLWIATRGACVVGSAPVVAPCQAALWGLGRVAAREHPATWGGLIDLDPGGSSTEVEALLAELLTQPTGEQVAFREGRRHAARLVTAPSEEHAAPLALSAEASYLVTGGLDALGLLVARWLVERGARHLILTSRDGLPHRTTWGERHPSELRARIAAVEALEALGARVTTAAADTANLEAMAALLAAVESPLRGVVQAAHLRDDGLLAHHDADRFAGALRPMVEGAWTLHTLTREQPLDFFVVFSSLAGVLGSIGQGSIAAGSAFLDALADLRRTQGLSALSVAWGPWAEGAMGSEAQRRDNEASGALSLPTTLALSAMERLIATNRAQRVVARIDWALMGAALQGASGRFLERVVIAAEASPSRATPAPRRWRGQSANEARAGLKALVSGAVAAVLGFTSASAIDTGRGFTEQGLDSLMSVQLRNRLQTELGVSLSATLAFDYPTVDRLVAHFLADVLDLEEQAELPSGASMAVDEPIAIVGAACRLPGGADDLDAYWQLLVDGRDATTEVPGARWSAAEWYDADPGAQNKTYSTRGGFLRDVETFDAGFFHISPREAASLDPQQRLLLEVSWEALEHAGQAPAALRDSPTGVFLGASYNEYLERLEGMSDEMAAPYALTGNMLSIAAGRVSFFLGLHGPTLAVDTACSSSLVALHLACQSLRLGECQRALVGGVNLLLLPSGFVMLSRMRALAPDGRCKTFSAAADGYGRAEGCSVVVVKRLRDAQRDGDRILAVIRGTAINHDGASGGLTVPNGPAQQAVLRQALAQARLAPHEVDYVECHGTGTPLGDPIEVQALSAVYGQGRPAEQRLVLGSAKANIGHLEPAAGLAGVIKVLLALEHEQIPAQPEFGELNPLLSWDTLPVTVARNAVPWPRSARPRRAGISSFGLSGTNAHVVLEEAPATEVPAAAPERSAELFVLSGRSTAAVDAQAAQLRDHLDAHPEQGLGDIAFGLATTRSPMEHRLAVAASSREGLRAALEAATQGQQPPGGARGPSTGSASKVVFVFPGQGSQWLGMSRQLLAQEPVFRAALEECDRAVQAEAGWSLLAELGADEAVSQLGRIDVVQPILFAMEVALAAQWRSWGVEPDAVVGHSMGEVAAAYVAGALSLEDAVAIICRRSLLLLRISGQGEMAMVGLSLADAEAALQGHEDQLSVAVSNSPSSTVLSGEPAALSKVLATLEAKGVFCRRVKVDVASHSPQVDPLREDIMAELSQIEPRETIVSMLSTVTGATVAGPDLVASYWANNLRQPVRFAQAVGALLESGHYLFVEMSPHPILMASVEEIRQQMGKNGASVGSLRRGRDERSTMLEALGALWVEGYPVSWEQQFPAGSRRVLLPSYPWQRQRHWIPLPKQHAPTDMSTGADGALWTAVARGSDAVTALLGLPEALHGSVDTLLPHIAAWGQRRDEEHALARLVYDESWPLVAPPSPVADAHKGTWLLVLPSSAECPSAEPVAIAIEQALAEVGGRSERVETASIAQTLTAGLLAGARGVITLTALDETIAPEYPHTPRGLAQTLEIAKLMPTASRPTPLWIVTRGAVAVRPDEPLPAPLQALHAGFGRVFALEHTEHWGGLVDLPIDVDAAIARLLVASLGDVEDQIAVRAEGRHVRRLLRATPSVQREQWQPNGTVLITGGTGALGAHLARRLAERGARHVVLTSRRGPDAPGAGALADELEARGTRVSLVACDTSDAAELDQLFARLDDAPEAEALSAVFHAAGLLDDTIIANLAPAHLDRILQPKVAAAWAIHQRLASRRSPAPLVLFSSMAGFLGGMGQANYAAANAYLDALAQHRRALGLPAVSIQWGPWGGGGMVTADVDARARRRGLLALNPSSALRCLDLAMAEGRSLAVMDVDWTRFVSAFAADRVRPFLLGIDEARAALEGRAAEGSRPAGVDLTLRESLADLPDVERLQQLRSLVAATTARVLGISGASSIDVERGFSDLGLDSLMAVELRLALQPQTGLALPTTLAFDHPSIDAVARHLLEQLKAAGGLDRRHPIARPDWPELSSLVERLLHAPLDELKATGVFDHLNALTRPVKRLDPASPSEDASLDELARYVMESDL